MISDDPPATHEPDLPGKPPAPPPPPATGPEPPGPGMPTRPDHAAGRDRVYDSRLEDESSGDPG